MPDLAMLSAGSQSSLLASAGCMHMLPTPKNPVYEELPVQGYVQVMQM